MWNAKVTYTKYKLFESDILIPLSPQRIQWPVAIENIYNKTHIKTHITMIYRYIDCSDQVHERQAGGLNCFYYA